MEKIRIENLRSLKDTGQVELKPINVLVGGNSSGKSTFLRFFPLVKQSLGRKINGPILWAGEDDDYVDFGSFDEALNYNSGDGKLKFEFEVKNLYVKPSEKVSGEQEDKITIKYILEKNQNTSCDYLSEMQFDMSSKKIVIKLSPNGKIEEVSIDGRRYKPIELPIDNVDNGSYHDTINSIFDISLRNIGRFAERKIYELTSVCGNEDNYYNAPNNENDIAKSSERSIVGKRIFADMTLLKQLASIYEDNILNMLKRYFREVYYIAPVRATAERYYRIRNSAVNEVDCTGKNIAVLLNSFSEGRLKAFQMWTTETLGFQVEKSLSEGHISLKIRKKDAKRAVNLSDMGFGYSQILPIIVQIWLVVHKISIKKLAGFEWNMSNDIVTIAIEQPELHLHPSLQAKIVDVIVRVMQNSGSMIRFIIETHSETIINRLGNLIYKEKLNKDQVNVMIFNKDFGDDDTTIQFGNFDEEGYLENWPAGFFEPEEVQ